jgi:regulator of RNase E activity RraB
MMMMVMASRIDSHSTYYDDNDNENENENENEDEDEEFSESSRPAVFS